MSGLMAMGNCCKYICCNGLMVKAAVASVRPDKTGHFRTLGQILIGNGRLRGVAYSDVKEHLWRAELARTLLGEV